MANTKVAAQEKGKARNKAKEDIPFPYVYFGWIIVFIAIYHKELIEALPPWEAQIRTFLIPERDKAMLPAFSFFVVCPLLYVWRNFVKTVIFAPLAVNWAGLKPGSFKYGKFIEQAWLALHYTIATSLGYYVLRTKPWWPPIVSEEAASALCAPQEELDADYEDLSLKVLYALQLGFYTLELATLLLSSHRRSDTAMYFFHHVYTMFLMAGSWVAYCHRIGSLVLFLHDIGDIFLPIGKCFTYAEEYIRETKSKAAYELHKMVGMAFFVMFVIAFAIPRLVLFGGLVYNGFFRYHWYGCCGILDPVTGEYALCRMGPMWSTALAGTLGLLYPMHVYWFYLIVKMAVKLLCAPGEYDDVRSGSEKDD